MAAAEAMDAVAAVAPFEVVPKTEDEVFNTRVKIKGSGVCNQKYRPTGRETAFVLCTSSAGVTAEQGACALCRGARVTPVLPRQFCDGRGLPGCTGVSTGPRHAQFRVGDIGFVNGRYCSEACVKNAARVQFEAQSKRGKKRARAAAAEAACIEYCATTLGAARAEAICVSHPARKRGGRGRF